MDRERDGVESTLTLCLSLELIYLKINLSRQLAVNPFLIKENKFMYVSFVEV